MSTITKERIELFIKSPLENGLTRGEQMELARIALASLEAKPIGAFHIAEQQVDGTSDYLKDGEWPIDNGIIEVYAAPPVPVVPEEKPMPNPLSMYTVDAVAAIAEVRGWNACRAAMLHGAEPVSQTYNLPELIEGMEVSIDVSTCDADLGNRYFGTVTEALELDTAKNGYILLVQDAEPNFDINGNSPVTPDGWVIVPKKLTAENGAKGVLSGEFSETTFISCPECFGDDDCETCDGSGRIEIKVPVSWTTIKTIWAKGCEYFSIVAPQQDG
ncbi:molecular chaperone DnaJ [Escherichia coli]|nr:molecular chaperone DnaJ [Escherichia coli]EKN5183048.1 molecular chaperone DnaJ [Escherichia coli]